MNTIMTTQSRSAPHLPSARPSDELDAFRRGALTDVAIDDALGESFPASDPPAWNPGMARPRAAATPGSPVADSLGNAVPERTAPRSVRGVEMPRPSDSERSAFQALTSVLGAVGIALLVPFAILLVGLPVALAVRGLLEVVVWLIGAVR